MALANKVPARAVRSFREYLVRGEEVVVATRMHWITIAEPVGTAVVSFFFVVAIGVHIESTGTSSEFLFVLWLFVAGRAVYHWVKWWYGWFGATTKRLMLQTGVFSRKVTVIPLDKVSDMTYEWPALGHLLRYGEFVLDSVGSSHVMHSIKPVPHHQEIYHLLVDTLLLKDTAGDRIYRFLTDAPEPTDEPGPDLDDPDGLRRATIGDWEDWSQHRTQAPPSFAPHRPRPAGTTPEPARGSDADTQVLDLTDPDVLNGDSGARTSDPDDD